MKHLLIHPDSLGDVISSLPTFDFPEATFEQVGEKLRVMVGSYELYLRGFLAALPWGAESQTVRDEVAEFNADPKRAWIQLVADAVREDYQYACRGLADAQAGLAQAHAALDEAHMERERHGARATNFVDYLQAEGLPVPSSI